MSLQAWFKDKVDTFKDDFEFRLEKIILEITEKISRRMAEKDLNRKNLADKLQVSPPAVTKILNGTNNFTIRRLLTIADALDFDLQIKFKEKKVQRAQTREAEYFACSTVLTSGGVAFENATQSIPGAITIQLPPEQAFHIAEISPAEEITWDSAA
jgi:transcriptional regulator with XRE-family HTH domain